MFHNMQGGAAQRSQQIQVLDVLIGIDDYRITPEDAMEKAKSLILGEPGSLVTLYFCRDVGKCHGQAMVIPRRFEINPAPQIAPEILPQVPPGAKMVHERGK